MTIEFQATAMMLDPSDCGPAFIGLCQDTQEIAYEYPAEFFKPKIEEEKLWGAWFNSPSIFKFSFIIHDTCILRHKGSQFDQIFYLLIEIFF